MRLTSFTDYGLRVLMRLASATDQVLTTEQIATEFSISRNHLTKVVQDLVRCGYVTAQRGKGGGLRLAMPTTEIRLGDVTRQLEQDIALVECFRTDGGACVLTPDCRLRHHLKRAHEAFLGQLDQATLADVIYPVPAARK
jgi:Rrf2 family transcriptional regulator, nitric oxide-sensitive transcriptional repressor